MTITKTSKSSATRDQLRRLMNQHTAATMIRPVVSAVPAPVRIVAPVTPSVVKVDQFSQVVQAKPVVAPSAKGRVGERCTLRLSATELTKIDRLILETHQRAGERITISDVLRIGLARINDSLPVAHAEIATLRAADGRRSKVRHE